MKPSKAKDPNIVRGLCIIDLLRNRAWLSVLLVALLCSSCITMGAPKTAKVEPSTPTPAPTQPLAQASSSADKKLVDTWELQYEVNEKGDERRPRESTRTLIEFTDGGQVIFNRIDKEESDAMKSRSGKYAIEKEEISITDDAGNNVKWPYQVAGDTLVLVMPEVKKKFYWRRYR
jgi:hypothetical protein